MIINLLSELFVIIDCKKSVKEVMLADILWGTWVLIFYLWKSFKI